MSWFHHAGKTACTAAILGLAAPAAAQETYKPDDKVPRALAAQITPAGFEALSDTAKELVPTLLGDTLALDDIDVDGGFLGGLTLAGLKPNIAIDELYIVPVTPAFAGAELQLFARLDVALNSPGEPYSLNVDVIGIDACSGAGWINNVTVDVGEFTNAGAPKAGKGIPLELVVIDGELQIDVTLPSNRYAIKDTDASGSCAGAIEFAVFTLSDVLIDAVVIPELRKLINGQNGEPGLIDDVNESLKAATIDMSGADAIDILGKGLNVQLTPRQATTTDYGLELSFDSKFSMAQDPCVADIDPLGSLKTNTPIPDIAAETGQVAALISDDMVNQAIYAVGSGGVLCIDALDLLGDSVDLPIPLNDELIYLIAGDEMRDVVDPGSDIQLLTQPTLGTLTSTVHYDGAVPIEVDLQDLEVNIYADVAGRRTRVVGVAADALVGIDLAFDNMTGDLGIDLALDDAFSFENVGDEFYPGQGTAVADGLEGLLGQLLGLLLPSLTGDLAFQLPSFSGIGLDQLTLGPGGSEQDWLRGQAGLGLVPYGADGGDGGCGGCGGDTTGGDCGGGCTNGGLGFGTYLLLLGPLVALRRRRKD